MICSRGIHKQSETLILRRKERTGVPILDSRRWGSRGGGGVETAGDIVI